MAENACYMSLLPWAAARKMHRIKTSLKDRPMAAIQRRKAPREIVMFIYPDAHLLDISGPMALFAAANDFAGYRAYEVSLAAASLGNVVTSAGIALVATRKIGRVIAGIDTLLVAGGIGIDAQLK